MPHIVPMLPVVIYRATLPVIDYRHMLPVAIAEIRNLSGD